ncbi:MAG: tetrahydromethanopterin S-methyltransferase subunit D [Methanobacteriaceae archaeon]|jgi:tetrahydromethanopterin S-methyltransferase subunit D|nr:tetrahydromethanopterin S-methyltransferase subunit D [Methanobacteriaceae archaeon]
MDPLFLILSIVIGGIMIGAGVHFIPVGGAPAAMATATGVGTGTAMLAAGAGLTGLVTAASMIGQPVHIIMLAGAIGGMMMMGITMFVSNLIYVFGVGVVPAASKIDVDPITGRNQEKYKTSGTEGHGIPTICFVSGIIGGLLGGAGGGLIYYAVDISTNGSIPFDPATAVGVAAIFSLSVFFVNAVVASYNIGGTIEGVHDPKFKRIGNGIIACGISSLILGIFAVFILGVI